MKVKLNFIEGKLLSEKLVELNKKTQTNNNFVSLELSKGGIKVISKQNNEELLTLPEDMFGDIFNFRNDFVADFSADQNELSIETSVRLHGHTGYSILDGMVKIKDLVKKTRYSTAITDHGVLYGCVDFYKKMIDAYKHPIIGFEAYTESIDGIKNKNHLVLLAKNNKGYKNLVKLCSKGWTNIKGRPHLKYEWIKKHSEGLVVLSACMGGEIPRALLANNEDLALKIAKEYKSIFGQDFYIEIQRHNIAGENELNKKLIKLARKLNLKIVATDDAHYLNKDEALVHEAHLCNKTKTTMDNPKRFRFPGENYHVHTCEELEELYSDIREALFNTLEVRDKCNFDFEFGNYKLPIFDIPEGYTENTYLEKLAWDGFKERFDGTPMLNSEEYKERLKFELDVINKMGYPSYFLIVADFIEYAKTHNVPVGPGRGSACGSLVAYALKITELDPIEYDLLFERFLSPDRVSMPDIDTDFGDIKRELVIEYCKNKYGVNAVSRIITFGTLGAKASILDMARVFNKSANFGRMITKLIPTAPKMTILKALDESVEFLKLYKADPEVKKIVDIAQKVEGLPRNISIHACGVVIAPSDVTDYCPQVYIEDEATGIVEATTQYTMTEIEELGLLKMDFLGLKTMTVLQENVDDINTIYGKDLTIGTIPINDPFVYDHISKGNTKGVFQLESPGMTSFMKNLFQDVHGKIKKASTKKNKDAEYEKIGQELFERLIAGISLYRPGPLDEIPRYIDSMLNPSHIEYDCDELKPILQNTYGVLVYQEQVMRTVRDLAGFTKGQADTIRKAMGKKKEEILDVFKPFFIEGSGNIIDFHTGKPYDIKGCVENGISREVAEKVWAKMYEFAKYAFNKSHAGGYANISIKTGYVSLYYPVIFMKANLNAYISNPDKVRPYLAYCGKQGINIYQPSVNKSEAMFTVEGKEEGIRFGLKGIKNVGVVSDLITSERNERGLFKSFQDFCERMTKYQKINSRNIESLIYAGALDEFEGSRKAKLSIYETMIESAKIEKKNLVSGQTTLFDLGAELGLDDIVEIKTIKTPDIQEFPKDYLLEKEKEVAGFYITEHPLDDFKEYLKDKEICEINSIIETGNDEEEDAIVIDNPYVNSIVEIAGIVNDVQVKYTKKDNKPFLIFTVEDKTNEIKCVAFDKEKHEDKIILGKKVILKGLLKLDDYGYQIMVNSMIDLELNDHSVKRIVVKGDENIDTARKQWVELDRYIKGHLGETEIGLNFGGKTYKYSCKINSSWDVINELQLIFGETNVKIS